MRDEAQRLEDTNNRLQSEVNMLRQKLNLTERNAQSGMQSLSESKVSAMHEKLWGVLVLPN